jgi:hypothetical protein
MGLSTAITHEGVLVDGGVRDLPSGEVVTYLGGHRGLAEPSGSAGLELSSTEYCRQIAPRS